MEKPSKSLVLNFRDVDSASGVCRETVRMLAQKHGVTETQYIHGVLASHVAIELAQLDDSLPTDEELAERNARFHAEHEGGFEVTAALPGIDIDGR